MKNIFRDTKNKILENENKKDEEQRKREERLEELEAAKEKQKGHFTNPVKSFHQSREMKGLQKEIADYKEKKKNTRMLLFGVPAFLAVFLVLLITLPSTESEEPQTPDSSVSVSEPEAEPVQKPEPLEPEKSVAIESEVVPVPEKSPAEEQTPAEVPAPQPEEDRLTVDDLSVSVATDYGHVRSEDIRLGQKEGATITVYSTSGNLTKDDVVIICDETVLDVQINEENNVVKVYVTGKSAGTFELAIVTVDDLELYGEDATGLVVQIRQLDASEGRIVYITPTGEKYHLSKDCAGDAATATTRQDAVDAGYAPCGKCAK